MKRRLGSGVPMRLFSSIRLSSIGLVSMLVSTFTWAATYYVAPGGNDDWGGMLSAPTGSDGPFRTLARAQAAVRNAISGGMSEDVTVMIREGEYALDTTLILNLADAGRNGFKVAYRNHPGEHPMLTHSRRITDWQVDTDGVYKAPVTWTFDSLLENGIRGVKARHPNPTSADSHVYNRSAFSVTGADTTKFGLAAGDVPVIANPGALEVVFWPAGPAGLWNWDQLTFTVDSIDYTNRTLTLGHEVRGGRTASPLMIGAGSRYYIQGARELLDQPGEFWVGNGFLYYRPRQTPIEQQTILVPAPPSNQPIIGIFGVSADQPVRDIRIEGLTFGFTDRFWAALGMSNAERVAIVGNHISLSGGPGIAVSHSLRDSVIENNLVHDTGEEGIGIWGANTVGYSARNTVSNNHIHHTGQVTGSANAIQLDRTSANVVSHNLIHDTPRAAIHAGGSLGDSPPVQDTFGNVFEYNDVSRAVTDSQDSSPINAGSFGPDNVIRQNRVHDSDMPFTPGQGIYLDVTSVGTTVTRNVVHDLQQRIANAQTFAAFHVKGSGTVVRNNIVARNRLTSGAVQVMEVDSGTFAFQTLGTEIRGNIFAQEGALLYSFPRFSENQLGVVDLNLLFGVAAPFAVTYDWDALTTRPMETLDQWRSGHGRKFDQHSVTADPRFVDADRRDFRLRPDSPAYALGFTDIDHTAIGLRADFPFADLSESLDRLFVATAQSGPSATVRLAAGATAQLQVSGRTTTGYLVAPAASAITYASDQPAVAAVTAQGLVTAGTPGLATITITATHGGATKSTVLFVASAGAVPLRDYEFYNTTLKHYFRTAEAAEATAIDNGAAGPGWVRTGLDFSAYQAGTGPGNDVCRFYNPVANTHFFTADPAECAQVKLPNSGWRYEGLSFRIQLPVGGQCPAGTMPVYRNYNNRFAFNDSNHRFTTSLATYNDMVAQGWVGEGVVMCALA